MSVHDLSIYEVYVLFVCSKYYNEKKHFAIEIALSIQTYRLPLKSSLAPPSQWIE